MSAPSIIRTYVNSHPLLTYYALVFGITWGGMLIAVGPTGIFNSKANPAELAQFIYFAALAGPSLAGIFMTGLIHGRAGLRDLLVGVLRWRVSVRWYLVALLTAPLLMTAILFGLSLASPGFIPAIVTTDDRVGLMISGVVMGLVVCFFEELGWTGFATPELLKCHGFLRTGIIMGLPWGAWHFPLFSGSASSSGALPPTLTIAVMLFSFLIPFRVLMVWVYDRTKSVLVVMLMHAPLAAGMMILLPSTFSGERVVTFDLAFAAALWVVVGVVYLASSSRGRVEPQSSHGRDAKAPTMTVATLSGIQKLVVVITLGIGVLGVFVAWRFQTEIEQARARVAQGSTVIATPCGQIEYQETGSGIP